MGDMQLQAEVMYVRVLVCEGKTYMEGYPLRSLGLSSKILGELDDYYEITEAELDAAISQQEKYDPSVVLEKKYQDMSMEQLNRHLYGRKEPVVEEQSPKEKRFVESKESYQRKLEEMVSLRKGFENQRLINEAMIIALQEKEFAVVNDRIFDFLKEQQAKSKKNPAMMREVEDLLEFFRKFLNSQKKINEEFNTYEEVEVSSFGAKK